ncbi:MAG: hypothetical protein M1826_004624 [Phylliscum demangeonii]|nr:MAG: hypothetical protein M1826_004624 [Phylliscum demangeonii]
MSARFLYKNDVDFQVLAHDSPDFAKILKANGQLDFSNPKAIQQLTISLLKRDFKLEINLPDDRLCPPVPNRFNYILWLQDLLDTTSDRYTERYDPAREVTGLDMYGVSSMAHLGRRHRGKLYLSVTRMRAAAEVEVSRYSLRGEDIDEKNVQCAQENVSLNKLNARIKVVQTTAQDALIPIERYGLSRIDFCMCNPPFYDSVEEMVSSAQRKQRAPFSACTGAEVEMVTAGGEVGFVKQMVAESQTLRDRVQWYTSMLGKHRSVATVLQHLQELGARNWAVTAFVQGTKTRRWAVAWSWADRRPRTARGRRPTTDGHECTDDGHVCEQDLARGIAHLPKALLPFPSHISFVIRQQPASIDELGPRLDAALRSLPAAHWRWTPSLSTGLGFVVADVWSRAFRRRKQTRQQRLRSHSDDDDDGDDDDDDDFDDEDAALGFKIQLLYERGPAATAAATDEKARRVVVVVRWLKGNDSVLFESFCGMLRRTLDAQLGAS